MLLHGDRAGEYMKIKKIDNRTMWLLVVAAAALGMVILLLAVNILGKNEEKKAAQQEEDIIELQLVYAYQNAQWNSAIEKSVEKFEKMHSDIKIQYQIHYENKVYENILNKLIARDELGDIVQLKTPQHYAASGVLGSIQEDVAARIGSKSVYVEDGKIYGIGMVNSTSGIIYNKDMFEHYNIEEPTTYGEFLECCRKLSRHWITPIGVGGSDLWHMEFWVNHFFRTDILSQNPDWQEQCSAGITSWTDEEVGEMFSHLQELFDSGYVDEDWLSISDGQLSYMMSQGEIAMIYGGPWTCEEIQKLNPDMNLGWFYVPDEEGNIYVGENRDTFLAVTAACQNDEKKYEAAMEFLEFFYSEENYADVRKSITAFSAVEHYRGYDMTEIQKEVTDKYTSNTRHITGFVGDSETPQGFEEGMLNIVQQMLEGNLTNDQAQQMCQDLWQQCMDEESGGAS